MNIRLAFISMLALTLATAARADDADENAGPCASLVPASAGGPVPHDNDRVLLRFLGTSNYELAYKGQVILLDAYYDRGPRTRAIGLMPDQVKRANAIFLGHGLFNHMSDAVSIGRRLGIQVVGGPPTYTELLREGLSSSQAVSVTGLGGEVFQFRGFKVEAVLAHHSVLSGPSLGDFHKAIADEIGNPTPEQAAAEAAILARGTFSPDVITKGTIAYVVTFDSGFRVAYVDSAGPVTPTMTAFMKSIGHTDVAIVAYQGHFVQETQIPPTLALIKVFNPRYFLPAHHDEIAGTFLDLGLEPLALTLREQMPAVKPISLLYRSAACFSVHSGKQLQSDD